MTIDVRMPDGTIVKNVPDDITQEDLTDRYSQFKNQNPQLRNLQYRTANPTESQPMSPVEIGSLIGGTLGMAFPPIAPETAAGGAALGGMLGTITGASIGKSGEQIYKGVTGQKQYSSPSQVLGEYPSAVAEQALYQLAGQTIGAGVVKAGQMASPILREGVGKAQEMLLPKKGSLSVGQMGHSGILEPLESFARAGVGGKGMFIEMDKRNADALQAIKDDLIKGISTAPVDDVQAGKIFADAVAKGDAAHQIASAALYKDFDSRVGGAVVNSAPVQQFGSDLAERLQRIGNVGKSEAGGRLIDQLKSLPATMTFSDAQALRSNLLAQVRDLSASGTESKALATAKKAASLVDESMNESAQALPDDLVQQFRQINRFYRQGKEAFNNEVVRDLVRTQPERVGETLFRSGNVSEIAQVKDTLDFAARMDKSIDKDAVFNRLKAGYLNGLLTSKAATNIEGETTAQTLMKTLAEAKTQRQFEVMFTDKEREAIQDFARTAYLTLRNKPSGFGIVANILQAGALGDLVSGSNVTGSPYKDIGLLASPVVMATIFTNPRALGVLTKALKIGVEGGTPMATKFLGAFNDAVQSKPEKLEGTIPQSIPQRPQIQQPVGGFVRG